MFCYNKRIAALKIVDIVGVDKTTSSENITDDDTTPTVEQRPYISNIQVIYLINNLESVLPLTFPPLKMKLLLIIIIFVFSDNYF